MPKNRRAAYAVFLSLAAIIGSLSTANSCHAGHPRFWPFRCLFQTHDHQRAGCPQRVHEFALPTYTPAYGAGWVGGSALYGGDPRTLEDGTWGRDYEGLLLRRRVWLDWWHGRRYQDGGGSYTSDGPKLFGE